MDEEYIKLLQQQAAAGSEMAIFELQQLGYDARIPDADASHLTFEALFPYAKTLGLGLKGLRAFNAARFTGTPGSMYRGIGIEGLKDLQKSGVLRPSQNISPIKVGAFDIAKDYNKIQKGVYASPSVEIAKRYGQGVVAEIPEGAAKFMQRYKGTNWSQKTQDLLPIDNINVFKQNFFGKYKPVKFNYGGDMKKIKKYPHGGPHSTMLPEVTVTPQMEELRDRQKLGMYSLGDLKYEPSFFGQGKYFDVMGNEVEGMGATTGIAPDPSGMSIKQLFKLAKKFPDMMKFAKDNYGSLAKIGDKVQDAYLKAKQNFDLGLYNIGKADLDGALEKASKIKMDDLESLMNQIDKAGDIIGSNRYKLIPDIKSIKSGTRGGVLDDIDQVNTSMQHQLHQMREARKAVTSTDMDATYRDFLIKGGDIAKKRMKDLQLRLDDIGGGLLKEPIEEIDRTLMRSLSPVNRKYKGTFDLLDINPNLELNPLLGSRFPADAESAFKMGSYKGSDMFDPRLSPGESVILDMYKNPFKMNKYGGSNMKKYENGGKSTNPPFMSAMNRPKDVFIGPLGEPTEKINALKAEIARLEEAFNSSRDIQTARGYSGFTGTMRDISEQAIKAQEELKRLTGKNKKYGGKSMDVDYEAEGGEVVIGDISVNKMYNGGTAKQYKGASMYMLGGPSHADGGIGIKMNSDKPSYVFTDRLKVGGKKSPTYADEAAKFGNRLDEVTTMAMGGDSYDRATAKLMKPKIMSEVSNLFTKQEEFKKENNIDQEPRQAAFGEAFAAMASSAGMSTPLAAAQFIPGLINVGKGLFGKAPELEYDPIVPEMQEYQDFNPLIQSYQSQQDRSLAGLRSGLQGSGATGSQLRAGLQAGASTSQANASNFLSQVGQMQAQSNRQTDQFNIGQQMQADQANMQMQMAADQFALQNDPSGAFSSGLSQLLGTATGMSREGFQRDLMSKFMGTGSGNDMFALNYMLGLRDRKIGPQGE